jgi:RNA polymerase-binding transcription factor DksA
MEDAERAQIREQEIRDEALAKHQQRMAQGEPVCRVCGETINPMRMVLGANLCLEHQQAEEDRQRRLRKGP